MTDTACRKCKTPMEQPTPAKSGWLAGAKFTVTGYLCKKCRHWNSLKRRKANKSQPK